MNVEDRFRSVSVWLGGLVCLGAAAVLCGWALGVPLLKSGLPGLVTMKANTAVCFLLLGASVVLLREDGPSGRRLLASRLAAGLAILISALTLAEYVLGVDLRIDQLLFTEPPGELLTSAPGRMALNTAVAFISLGAGALAVSAGDAGPQLAAHLLALGSGLLGLLSLLGYLYGADLLYFMGLRFSTAMAVHTTLYFVMLAAALLLARPRSPLMRPVSSGASGGIAFRRIVPAAALFPVLAGWLILRLHRGGFMQRDFGVTLVALSSVSAVCVSAYLLSRHLNALDAERDRAMAELDEKNREVEELVHITTHDLRVPLVNIRGFGELLFEITGRLAGPRDKARAEEAYGYVRAGAKRMEELLAALLRYSRAGRAALKTEKVDMAALAGEAAAALEFTVKKAGGKITLGALPPCAGDAGQLKQLFSNLLDNAVKYARPGVPPRVAVSGGTDGGFNVYTVSDNGRGVKPEELDRIWQIFYRGDPGNSPPGEGVGLAMARKIAARHGGSLEARVNGDGGLDMVFRLPAA